MLIIFLLVQAAQVLGQGYTLGSNCDYDEDCYMDNSYCYLQKTCECKHNFIPNEEATECLATICRSNYECASLKWSSCVSGQDGIGHCQCNHGYISDPHNRECLPAAQEIGGPCIMDNQCQERLGDSSFCFREKCACHQSYHFDRVCVKNRGLGESCYNRSQCYIGEAFKNTMECASGVCVCQYGYYNYGGICRVSGLANNLKPSFIISTFVILNFFL